MRIKYYYTERELELKRRYRSATGKTAILTNINEFDSDMSGLVCMDKKFYEWLIYQVKIK